MHTGCVWHNALPCIWMNITGLCINNNLCFCPTVTSDAPLNFGTFSLYINAFELKHLLNSLVPELSQQKHVGSRYSSRTAKIIIIAFWLILTSVLILCSGGCGFRKALLSEQKTGPVSLSHVLYWLGPYMACGFRFSIFYTVIENN